MELRRILLRILLLALALAAVTGVAGVITAAGDTIWRIVWTAGTTAVAVAIMLPFSRMMDKQKSRAAGLGGMVWTVVAYLLVVALIWSFSFFRGHSAEESIAMTLLAWTLCGLPAIFLLRLVDAPDARIAARTGLAIAAASFAMLMVWAWGHTLWSHAGQKWWESGLVLGGLGVLAVTNLAHAGTADRRWWRWLAVAALAAAWLLAEAGIYLETSSPFGRQVLTLLTSIGAVLGLANLALLAPLVGQQQLVRWGTLAAAAICAGAINMLVGEDLNGPSADLWGRIASGSGIVAGCGSLALLVLARINRRVEFRPDDAAVLASDIAVVCPRCSKSQRIPLGGASCHACGLRIEITIEEPRCPTCGYLLYKLTSPICPECGTPIARAPAEAT